MSDKPRSRIPNSISEEELSEKELTKREFCEATNWCSDKDETTESEEYEEVELETDENGIPILEEEKEYQCPKCQEIFDTKESFLEHWSRKHEEKYGAYGEYASKEFFDTWLKSKHTFRRHYDNLERYAEALKRLKKNISEED